MSETGTVTIEVGKLKTTLRKFETRLQFSAFSSICLALFHLSSFYDSEGKMLKKKSEDKSLNSTERRKAFEEFADLEKMFAERSIPIYEKILSVMTKQIVSGTPMTEYSIVDLTKGAGSYAKLQTVKEEEAKNSKGGPDLSSATHQATTAPSAKAGSGTPKEPESVEKPSMT